MTSLKPLSSEDAYMRLVDHKDWIVERNLIYRDFRLKDFKSAIEFINSVAEIAEEVGHHPNILLHEYYFVRAAPGASCAMASTCNVHPSSSNTVFKTEKYFMARCLSYCTPVSC